jgi:glycosyltransferase involved in cell wall biosynthesis
MDYGIVVFSHLRWNFVWQRPQQFLSRFAKAQKVLFIEEAEFTLADGEQPKLTLEQVDDNITVAALRFPPSARGDESLPVKLRAFAHQAIKAVNEFGEFDKPLLWYYSPMEAAWSLGHFRNRGIVYDCMDELSQFAGAPKELVRNEAMLLAHADIVFTGGYELFEKKSQYHDNVHCFGCGVEYDHFAKAQEESTPIPDDIKDLPKPIIGWFGVVDERMDYDLVSELAARRPEWSFVMVGPVVKVDADRLPQRPNIYWLGRRDYKVLPNYCRGYDVCFMPFALNEATEYINPTKALEYLATGRPVVSTPVKDVVRQYSELVLIGRNVDEVEAHIEAALNKSSAQIEKGIEKARACSWEGTVDTMRSLIEEAIGYKADPKSKVSVQ